MGTPLVLLFALFTAAPPGCDAMRGELAPLTDPLREPATVLEAAPHLQQAMPPLEPGKHYVIQLTPENRVAFIVAPRRPARDDEPHGGILYLDVREAGRYRIAIDTGHWIDVIDSGPHVLDASSAHVVESSAHFDIGECTDLRKVVDFDLEAGKTYRVHLSGRADARVTVVVARGGESAK